MASRKSAVAVKEDGVRSFHGPFGLRRFSFGLLNVIARSSSVAGSVPGA
jgi:hypothetical protein